MKRQMFLGFSGALIVGTGLLLGACNKHSFEDSEFDTGVKTLYEKHHEGGDEHAVGSGHGEKHEKGDGHKDHAKKGHGEKGHHEGAKKADGHGDKKEHGEEAGDAGKPKSLFPAKK